ncbi:MAG: site-specific DNA-methyltransferase [Anaerolineae bacterium]|nr:site-specific DNA-methyltransferase [Anaerolineae bacterium]
MAVQLALTLNKIDTQLEKQDFRLTGNPVENLVTSLSGDLNFTENTKDAHLSHKAHSFPAKFPPQLPRKFILELTSPGDVVLDPMMGSGTTLLEAFLQDRQAIGFDIDPLAMLLAQVKTEAYNTAELGVLGNRILKDARKMVHSYSDLLTSVKSKRFDEKTIEFIDYWFTAEVQLELLALSLEIEKIESVKMRDFFRLIFSSIIITKTGGVSMALDLAHTRPHKAKTIFSKNGKVLAGDENEEKRHLVKILRSPLDEFEKKLNQNLRSVITPHPLGLSPIINFGSAQSLALASNSVDLVVTSPPYASNAIDYMRAHKFSLVWFGFPIGALTDKRKTYIGSEGFSNLPDIILPPKVEKVIEKVALKSKSKGISLRRYYVEMTMVLQELFRVLKPQKSAIVVVGNSTLASVDAQVNSSLVEIGKTVGFDVPMVGIRQLDRNRRMLPAGSSVDKNSQIQQRMHEEFVIGFYKP